ncbi:MAG TPA: ABC transporter substrate-binding protein [Solirubrobacterales bacterium]|nr:ABC transporter substrate-binding protein [Solirubrobacterales bacterium]
MLRPAVAALLLSLLVAGCGVAGGASIEAPVTVYVSLPLTGPQGPVGTDAADGARLAFEEAGGKAGAIEVRARYLDDAKSRPWDPVAVGANARRAVQDSSAAAYIGELDSEPTRASVPITNDAGLVQVSPGAGAVDLTGSAAGYPDSPDRYQPSGTPSFVRTVPSDDVVVGAAAQWASDLGAKLAAVHSDGSAFQNLATSEFKSAAAEHGVQVVSSSAEQRGVARYDPGTQRLGFDGRLYELSAQLDAPMLPGKKFHSQFARRYRRSPGPYAAYGYEAMALVLQAIGEAGTDASSFRDNVREEVFGAHRDGTVLGSYGITSDGDTTECMIQRYRIDRAASIAPGIGRPDARVRVPVEPLCPTG